MDLSPQIIERTHDITSWLEGDISQLVLRDRTRYWKRKSAIEDYFKTNQSVEEISLRHRISSKEPLEELVKRCFMLHEDGQPWGFRALVPGAQVVDQGKAVEVVETKESSGAGALAEAPGIPEQKDFEVTVQEAFVEDEKEDTAERPAVRLVQAGLVEEPHIESEVPLEELSVCVEQKVEVAEEATSKQHEPPAEQKVEMAEEAPDKQHELLIEQKSEVFRKDDNELNEVLSEQQDVLLVSVVKSTKHEETVSEDEPGEVVVLDSVEAEKSGDERREEVIEAEAVKVAAVAVAVEEEKKSDEERREAVIEAETVKFAAVAIAVEAEKSDEDRREAVVEAETVKFAAVAVAVEEEKKKSDEERCEAVVEAETVKVASVVVAMEEAKSDEERREEVAETETVVIAAVSHEQQETEAVPEEAEVTLLVVDMQAAVETQESATSEPSSEVSKSLVLVEGTALEVRPTLSVEEAPSSNSRQLIVAEPFSTPMRSLVAAGRYRLTGSKTVIRRSVLRRWERRIKQKKHQRWVKMVSIAVIATLLVILLIPLCLGVIGYSTYINIKSVANDGISHLMAIKQLIPANKNDLTSVLSTQKLAQAKADLVKAHDDFLQLQDMVNRPDIQAILQEFAPQYGNELGMVSHLLQVGLDVSDMGQELVGVAQLGANIIHGSPLSGDPNKPLLTADDVTTVEAALVHAQYYLSDVQTQMSQVDLAQLPLGSPEQKTQLAKYVQLLPQAQSTVTQARGLVGPVAWLLGVGQQRNFLVQTLDRGELRPSGGFEGQYGKLTLTNGRMGSFSLTDVTKIDYAENGAEFGAHPPSQYSWMDFGNFGVRDANLSADYPTTAQLVMRTFEQLGGGPLDGDIQITPVVIEQFLQLTGPIYIADYQETVTADNLETKIHLYQQNYQFIDKQQQVTGTDTHQTRKAFTNLLGQLLLARIKKMQVSQLVEFGKIMLKDLKSRDLQIYFTDPAAEQWLVQNDDGGAMPSFTNGIDGFMVVQANISISKAAEFVHSTFNDQVQLDAQGGATHNLTITLDYQKGDHPVYGFNSYADYLRVYAPSNAQLINAYGFNTGATLCTPNSSSTGGKKGGGDNSGSYVDTGFVITGCGSYYHSYPDSDNRYCPDGNYELGYSGMMGKPWAIQRLGAPTSMNSDLPGYSMWGGLTLTPMNCTSTLTFQWYVPNVVQNTAGQPPYQMIVGHQAGWPDTAQVNIDASQLQGVKSLSYNQTINVDTLIALANRPLPSTPKKQTTPTPVVTPTPNSKKR
jgi:hypothetical protein